MRKGGGFALPGRNVWGIGDANRATQGCVEEAEQAKTLSVKGRAEVGGAFSLNLPGFIWKSVVFRFQLQLFSCKKLF